METKEPKINYLCDGEVENCKKKTCYKTNCYKGENANEIVCKYIKDIRHAKNFQKMFPNIPQAAFWEKDTASNERTQCRD